MDCAGSKRTDLDEGPLGPCNDFHRLHPKLPKLIVVAVEELGQAVDRPGQLELAGRKCDVEGADQLGCGGFG